MKPIIIANWKCNPLDLSEAKSLFGAMKRISGAAKGVEIVVCPPFPFLSEARNYLGHFNLGSQDCFWEKSGPYTGEVSPDMLKNLGCKYVIAGHYERRRWLGEDNEKINRKIRAAISVKLTAVYCIGETKEERERDETSQKIEMQIREGLISITKKEIQNIILAYEPVWAIGSGKPCEIDEAMSMNLLIRKILSNIYNRSISAGMKIIYGGSVDRADAGDYTKSAGFQGLLVGGASLDSLKFSKIIKEVK